MTENKYSNYWFKWSFDDSVRVAIVSVARRSTWLLMQIRHVSKKNRCVVFVKFLFVGTKKKNCFGSSFSF